VHVSRVVKYFCYQHVTFSRLPAFVYQQTFVILPCSCRWGEIVSGLRPTTGVLFVPHVICECGESLLNWQEITSELEGKAASMPLCPPQIPGARTRASAARGRQLTAWAMLRPYFIIVVKDFGVTKFCPFYQSTDFFCQQNQPFLKKSHPIVFCLEASL
jgi:hypothetical protein